MRQHKIMLAGVAFVPHISGALYAPDHRTLLVADLHLEQGASLARRGLNVPPFDTLATLAVLAAVIAETRPQRLVLLGDSFHDRVAHIELPEPARHRIETITASLDTIWISGNHDPVAPRELGGQCVASLEIAGITLRHEPSRARAMSFEIAGHLHPGASIVQRGISTRAKCFIADDRRIIMPAFGSYTGALGVQSNAFYGLFEADKTNVWMLRPKAIHRFPLRRVT